MFNNFFFFLSANNDLVLTRFLLFNITDFNIVATNLHPEIKANAPRRFIEDIHSGKQTVDDQKYCRVRIQYCA